MRSLMGVAGIGLVVSLGLLEPAAVAVCPDDSVASGTVCIDKYESSVWYVPPEQKGLIARIQSGTVTLASLMAAGTVQLGIAPDDLAPFGCPANGNGCVNVYAASIPDVMPARFINWFQAAAAARNSLKRLPTNQEWQVAALGTPDGAPCNVDPNGVVTSTGSAPGCVSDVGSFDTVGNVVEWVADWVGGGPGCFTWPETFGSDLACPNVPLGMIRGGSVGLFGGTGAGVFSYRANLQVTVGSPAGLLGFRCAR